MAKETALFSESMQYQEGLKTGFYAMLGSLFIAVFSQLALYLPYSPIPQTMQTLSIFLVGGVLGPKRGVYAVLAYLGQGSAGLPVFAGGIANPLWFASPTAGFLFSFVIVAFLIGKMVEGRAPSFLFLLLTLCFAQIIVFTSGWGWLAYFIGAKAAFTAAVTPFIMGAALKIISGACILKGYFYKKH